MNKLNIREADESDLRPVVDLYQSVRAWLDDLGLDQWAANTDEKMRARIYASIRRGECFVAEADGRIIGSITVDEFADPEFWRRDDGPNEALYVHRMIVDREVSGENIGGRLLDWANELAARKGKRWLRLDAWRTNDKLHSYYLSQGFETVRIVSLSHRGSGALFQRSVPG